jgi:pantoate--beta-alanine ligase
MRLITSLVAMQRLARQWKAEGRPVGFVPTMGYLHAGHLSLVAEARRRVTDRGVVVVSIYANPLQFAPHEDLARYPRDLPRDKRLCREAGVDVVFLPSTEAMYASEEQSPFSTYVSAERLSQGMEGVSRPAHFRGVATVVAKLFNLVLPDVAVFGAKDFQQAAIVRRMIRDLNFPVRLVVAPTVREADGLAMSSRNQYLTSEERTQATVLCRALKQARGGVRSARTAVGAGKLREELLALIHSQPAARADYIAFFDPATLEPVERVRPGHRVALAVYIGRTRLIDNAEL